MSGVIEEKDIFLRLVDLIYCSVWYLTFRTKGIFCSILVARRGYDEGYSISATFALLQPMAQKGRTVQ